MVRLGLPSTRCSRWLFFFSSRRRHTRCSRDWSSDVCSSDLLEVALDRPLDVGETENEPIKEQNGQARVILGKGMAPRAVGAEKVIEPVKMREIGRDRKSTRLNSSHGYISYAVFCLKKKKKEHTSHQSTLILNIA